MLKSTNQGVGNLTVKVYEGNSLIPAHFALVKITGHIRPPGHFKKPVSLSANTGLLGSVKFTDIPLDIYKIEISRKWYEPTITNDVAVKTPGKDRVGHFMKPNHLAEIKFPKVAPWMETAMKEIGQREIPGPIKANPRIIQYHRTSGFDTKDDSGGKNAWCASFVSWVMKQHGYALPSFSMRASSWGNFGKIVSNPTFGAIGIKRRVGGGHVAFVIGKSPDGIFLYMLGGNQKDDVNISKYKKTAWDSFVVPTGYNYLNDILPRYTRNVDAAGRED